MGISRAFLMFSAAMGTDASSTAQVPAPTPAEEHVVAPSLRQSPVR